MAGSRHHPLTVLRFPAYLQDDESGRLAARIPGAMLPGTNAIPEEKPPFALLQFPQEHAESPAVSDREILRLASALLRRRVPIALLDARDELSDDLMHLAATAARNGTPAVLLNSFRFVPAVAALKEIAISGVLGTGLQAAVSPTGQESLLDSARLRDAASWISGNAPRIVEAESALPRITVTGTAAEAVADFSPDGQIAELTLKTPFHTHTRSIPRANPLVSELAVLSALLQDPERKGRIKTLPLMMPLSV